MRLQETLERSLRSEIERHQKQNGYTLRKLSDLSGINHGHLSDILRSKRSITIGQLDSLGKAFGKSSGWLYELYTEECFPKERVSRPRVIPYLIQCAEIGLYDCIQKVVSKLLDDRRNLDILFSVAEQIFESGKRKESIFFYKLVIENEKDSHSDRFAISQYRLFRASQGANTEENWEALIRFERYRNRLPENHQLDGLLQLSNVCFVMQRWSQMESYADELRSLAIKVYNNELRTLKSGKTCEPVKTERSLVVYYGQGFLLKGVALQMQGLYREAREYIKGYADLAWFELLDEVGLKEVEKFRIWAKANLYTSSLLMGETGILPDYLEFLSKNPTEVPAGLLTISEAASKYDIDIDDILTQFSVEIDRLSECKDSVNIGRHYNIRYYKVEYELKKGRINNALEDILYCLDLADQMNNQQAFKQSAALFWAHRQHASEHHERIYQEIVGRSTE
ncbi:helix-turn-helix domain-containing protein [Brevibacillus sp. NPDC003359]|uniref:helix-turn-helix domain-containing protein n=1 Tax=unclassified Brevibacillus TaxID=2684853 RepID=UPI0036AAADFE